MFLIGMVLVVVENNFSGQLADIIKEKTGMDVDKRILKYDGRPFYPDEIVTAIKEVAAHG